ncbi:MAG: dockerin type I domain-containing protein [Thiogranum sp.]
MNIYKLAGGVSGALFACFFAGSVSATQIVIANLDGPGEGFNDTTPAQPVGFNPGTTLGEQRLFVFQHAAKIWESTIDSNVDIVVEAKFDPLTCSATSAVLGSAAATTVVRDFPNAPVANTWYSIALGNSLAGSDLSASADITATFNGDIDNNNDCLNGYNWYYGLDGVKPANTFELLSVVMHEIGHGLGFQTFVDINTGQKLLGRDDTYMLKLEDHSLNQTWNLLSDAQRLASMTDTGDLHWAGPSVTSQIADYTGGVNQGHITMYAPDPIAGGSSVSHFNTALTPNELMEPFDTGPKSGPGLALQLFQDISWATPVNARPVITVLGDQTAYDGETIQVAIRIADNDTPVTGLTLQAASSVTTIVDAAGMSFSGSTNTRTLSITPLPGSSGATTIDVTVSDGSSSATESFTLNVIFNNPPVVTISSPADGSAFTDTDFVDLLASASDVEDGDVSASLSWSSSLDGLLVNGGSVSTTLSEGVHLLTATASDSLGKTGSLSRTVTIYGNGDTDVDGLSDNWEFSNFGSLLETATGDYDTDGLSNLGEFNAGTVPTDPDTDGDGISDGDEVNLYATDPTQSNTGDLGPRGAPDGVINAGDLVVMTRLVTGIIQPSTLEAVLADVNGDAQINVADLLLLQQAVQNGSAL